MMSNPEPKKQKMMDEKSMAWQESLLNFDLNTSADFLELDFLMSTIPSWEVYRRGVAPPAKVRDGGNPRELLKMVPSEVRKELFSLLDNVDKEVPKELGDHFDSLSSQQPSDSETKCFELIGEVFKGTTLHRISLSHGDGWLDDIAITVYVKLLKIREEHCQMTLGDKHEKTHIFDTRFTLNLEDQGAAYVMEWMGRRQEDVSDCKRMIFMFNDGSMHYVVISVDIPQRTVRKYDPMGSDSYRHHDCVIDLLDHLVTSKRIPYSKKKWRRKWPPEGTPRQKDQVSCGVVSCLYANLLSQGKSLESLQTCVNEPHYRYHIGALIACLHKGVVVNKRPDDTGTVDVEEETDNKQA